MAKAKLDTQSVGLDVGLSFIKWVTGAENLHYGLWDDLEVTAGNLGQAQAAYTDKLFGILPTGPLRILDIGGGAGETARKLIALGHDVEIVVPSAFLASRCRTNAPGAVVHEMIFEDFEGTASFDLCLFSESYQYIPLGIGLEKALGLVKPGGYVLVSDTFRSEAFAPDGKTRIVGGGHPIAAFRELLGQLPVKVEAEHDVTHSVAPSVDLEQGLFHVFGHAGQRIEEELRSKRPRQHWVLRRAFNALVSERKRARLDHRLNGNERTATVFAKNNTYLMLLLRRA